jgi:hypothetical protein
MTQSQSMTQKPINDTKPINDARPINDAKPINDANPINDATNPIAGLFSIVHFANAYSYFLQLFNRFVHPKVILHFVNLAKIQFDIISA